MTIIASSAAIAVTLQKICRSVGVAVALFDGSHVTHWRLMVISLRPIDKRNLNSVKKQMRWLLLSSPGLSEVVAVVLVKD